MKGPKIENLRDPKWLGRKVVKCYCSGEESECLKILHQGIYQFFYISGTGNENSTYYDVQDYQSDFDWYEWIEEEKKTKFPFKVGDKIRRKDWNNKNNYVKIQLITPSIHENERKVYVEKHFSNTGTPYDIYFITGTDWELCVEDKPQEEPQFPYNVGDTIRHKSWIEENSSLEILAINGPHPIKGYYINGVLNIETKKDWGLYIAVEEFKDWGLYVENELQFPYKVGDKIRINWWKPDFYVELMVLDIKKREVIVKRFPGEIICDAADSKSAFYQDIVQSTAWELYVENELKFPFNVGDKIKPEWWNNEGKHLEILEINGPYFAQYQPKEARFEIVAKKSWHNGNTINRSVTYLITDKDFTKWSLWKNPDTLNDAPRLQLKKKKTVAFALTRNSNDSFYLSELAYTYDSEDSKIIKRSPNTIQFPAVTKDGTVLEFEVDDES